MRAAGSASAVQPVVSITLSPAAPASGHELTAAARLIGQRADRAGLAGVQVTVTGQDVVLTGPAGDQAELKALAGTGVLRIRQVLLQAAARGRAHGNARLVRPGVLRLFGALACKPGQSDAAWQRQAGYTTSADWDNPDAQIVSCDSSGTRYVLDVARVLGQEMTSARATQAAGQWVVLLTFNSAGASALRALTTRLYNTYYSGAGTRNQDDVVLDQIALVIDGAVLSAPEITSPVATGMAQVYGQEFTRVTAEELGALLQGGPLPVAFRITGTRILPPSASS
jgi:preprotein translocase subunit SecD